MPKHPHMSYEQCVERYPLLIKALQHLLIGSQGEAGCVIRDYRDGWDFSCEACSHSGLTPEHRLRHASRADWRRWCREGRQRSGVKWARTGGSVAPAA